MTPEILLRVPHSLPVTIIPSMLHNFHSSVTDFAKDQQITASLNAHLKKKILTILSPVYF